MKICSIADIHFTTLDKRLDLPEVDVITVSGDLTMSGSIPELISFRSWLKRQPAKHKVVIAGNHDFCFEDYRGLEARTILGGDGIHYLQDESIWLDNFHFYGSPWQPWFHNWAFNLERGPEIAARRALIPEEVDVLLVHGPPYGYGDLTMNGDRAGCKDLLEAIDIKRPEVVVYGHIHEDTGQWIRGKSKLINCSIGYKVAPRDLALRRPVVFELE